MRKVAVGISLALAVALSGTVPRAADAPGRLALSPDGATVWILGRDGDVTHLDLETGRIIPWTKEETKAPRFTDIVPSADGRILYALLPAEDGRTTLLMAYGSSAREATAQWEVRGEGRFLAVTPDGARACVVGLKPGAAGGRRSRIGDEDWTLTAVDLVTGSVSAPVMPGLEPRAVALMESAAPPGKLLLAARDRIATYTFDPLRASWYYKSPGDNFDIAAPGASPVVCTLRDASLAIIDPGRRTRDRGRVQLSEDDATTVVPLPARGRSLAVSGDGVVAAVLHDDGLAVTWIDLRAGLVMKTEPLGKPLDLMARRILGGGGEPLRLVMASWDAEVGAGLETRVIEAPAAPPSSPQPAARVEPQEVTPPPPEQQPAPVDEEPVEPEPPEQQPTPVEEKPVEPPRASSDAALTGRVSGDPAGALDVLFFGPDNILKLHARAKVAPDGTFRLSLPPPGRYRVVVSAGPGAHVFTRPEVRMIVVAADQKGLDGIDFEVRGRIK